MFGFLFKKKINSDLLRLSQIAYGGELYYGLRKYRQKELMLDDSGINKVEDNLLKKIGNTQFFSYKNEESGFTANLFENIKTGELVIAYRGTERIDLGENRSDIVALGKDILTDINLIMNNSDAQFNDAYKFYNIVRTQNPNKKIILVGQSLGGALVQIVAAKVYTVYGIKLNAYTYNAPGCRHLLELFGCNPNLNYSFVTNYAVMNDWCGMFGEKVGETYLVPPIPPLKNDNNSPADVIKNILLTSHEGIFEYVGEVFKKPKNFNQTEGLALWYYDINNPIKDYDTPAEFFNAVFQPLNMPQVTSIGKMIQTKAEEFLNERGGKFQEISSQIQTAANDFINAQLEKLCEGLNNNLVTQVAQFFDITFSQLTVDSLRGALKVLKDMNLHKTNPEYFNSFNKYIK